MGNMTLFIAGIAILSLGTYLMRLGGAKLGNRLAFFRALAGAAFRCGDGAAFFRRPGHHFL
ncbi:inner membrane protein [Klebsiella pneumoniae]|nr:inner membrane protein [Klebsiella pneumoniae]